MDDGILTGATGKVVDFTSVVMIMTSNLGALDAEKLKIGFGEQKQNKKQLKKQLINFLPQNLETD